MSNTINYTVSSGLNATLTTSGNYNFLQIIPDSSNSGTITFSQSPSPFVPFYCDILIVAGGGGGGGGWYGYQNLSGTIYTDYIGGGGGAGGQVIQSQIRISNSYNTVLNLTIGTGGIYTNPSGSSAGGNSSITSNACYIESTGGAPGASGASEIPPIPSPGGIGINGSGTGGLGGCSVYENNLNIYQINSTAATDYTTPDFFGFTIGPISGGGGGGNSNGETPTKQSGNGAGGFGGYYNGSTLVPPTNGLYGGGGGGNAYFGDGGKTPTSTPGSNGGKGVIWLRFPNTITIPNNLTNYNIPIYGDLSNIFYPLSLGGITGSTGTGYNRNIGSGSQDLTNLFCQYIPGYPNAPQTYFTSANYGGHDLNQIFQNINYPFPYNIIFQQNITITYFVNNGYFVILFEQNGTKNIGPPSPFPGQNGTSYIQFTQSISNVNILVVGGGGGGGGGNYNGLDGTAGGGGGAGGGVTIVSETSINTTPLSITVGCAGNGNSGNQGGLGNDAGGGGNSSIISYYDSSNNNISYTSGGGQPGLGSGTAPSGTGGGNGGSTSQTGGNDSNGGGGGGGGGGSNTTGSGTIYQGGTGGSNLSSGNTGGVGQVPPPSTSGPINIGQNGGASFPTPPSITIPFYSSSSVTFSLGGGGGGGGGGYGGGAGSGTGGTGNSSGTSNGISANNSITGLNPGYGGGGGGGGSGNGNTNSGGDGGNGVVMIWWPV
jgi:hypothetical protein